MNCYSVSLHNFFVMIFFKIVCRFYFFNIELVENYNYSFPHKTLLIATVFLHMVFFLFFYDFFKIVFVDFIFLILSWLRI